MTTGARHAGAYAIHDWFFGNDQQWLYDIDDDRRLYSHDHGLYLPPAGRGFWSESELTAHVATPNPLPDDPSGVSPAALTEVVEALRGIRRGDIVVVLSQVPLQWPVSNSELEALGWFLEQRAPDVADRLEALTV